MAQRLSRRRFAPVVKYLNDLIRDERQPHRMRLRAAERLLDLHERYDRAVERENTRGAKTGCKSTPEEQHEQDGASTEQEQGNKTSEEQNVSALFEEVLRPREVYAG